MKAENNTLFLENLAYRYKNTSEENSLRQKNKTLQDDIDNLKSENEILKRKLQDTEKAVVAHMVNEIKDSVIPGFREVMKNASSSQYSVQNQDMHPHYHCTAAQKL